MAASGTQQPPQEQPAAFVPPPRRKTSLTRYSRKSKMVAAAVLTVAAGISVFFIIRVLSSGGDLIEAARHHKPAVHSADTPEPMADAAATTKAPEVKEALNQQDDRSVPMAPAPDPGLTESTAQGDLPRISEDGREPWQVYARPFNSADKRPRLAIVVADLGMQRATTDAAVTRLPANVTLAFNSQSPTVGAWCQRARQQGHEVLLSIPMEPFDFPRSDPGPEALLTSLPNPTNLEKLAWSMRQASGYVGITTMTGTRFVTETDKLKPVMQAMKLRGLMVFDPHIAPHSSMQELAEDLHVPIVAADLRIDDNLSPEAIDESLQQLEQAAKLNGHAVGVVAPLPIVIDRLQTWLQTLPQAGIALAPVSAVVQ